ncbi:TPA: mercury(II) reductase [Legionella pneumophila]
MHLAIVGGGSAAFACALKAAEKSQVVLIESDVIGGTCVNVGCVPSKIFIRTAQMAYWQHQYPFSGLEKYPIQVDRKKQVFQQQKRVEELRQAKYESLIKENPNIQWILGTATFMDQNTLLIQEKTGNETKLAFDYALIATGASPSIPPIPGLQETPYWTSTEALVAKTIPNHLIVIGGSAVGLEIGQAFLHEGARVTVIDVAMLLPKEDPDIGRSLHKILEEEGMKIFTKTQIQNIKHDGRLFHVELDGLTLTANHLLVATGRKPNTESLNLKNIGIKTDSRGAVIIDEFMRTHVENIYAAGDCTPLPQFVYIAAQAGMRAAINILGGNAKLDLSVMPSVTFTDPQAASVGITEAEAKQKGIDVEVRVLTLDNVPRALVNFDTRGFIKLVAEKKSRKLLGTQVLSAEGGEIIQAAAIAIANQMTVKAISEQLFPYLTMVEGIKLCAQTFFQDVKQLSCCAG